MFFPLHKSLHTFISRSIPVLVVANSARMLTKLLVDNEFKVIAIDCYGDVDTQATAIAHFCLDSLTGSSFQNLILDVRAKFGVQYVFYGSGFESCATSLSFLEQHFKVIGNSSEVVFNLQNKPAFFQFLAHKRLSFPKVAFGSEDIDSVCVFKPYKSLGGIDVVFDTVHLASSQEFYSQEYIDGVPCSVTFIANGKDFIIVGFNRQLIRHIHEQPFVFSGLIAQIELTAKLRKELEHAIGVLLDQYALMGICSLDFMLKHEQIYLLEVNPRIPASAQLYDSQVMVAHIEACVNGVLPANVPVCQKKALHIVYSELAMQIPFSVDWPAWVVDRPRARSQISKNQPICSIIVEYDSSDDVELLLQNRELFVKNLLISGS